MIQLKKTILTLVALIAVTTGAWAQTQWPSGDCTVTLNNGTLTVSGKGAMADYQNSSDRPWYNNVNDITSVVVESGVTTVGILAFYNFSNMTSVTLPEGLTSIGYDAFYRCASVTDVNLYADPANLTWNEDGCDDFNRTVMGSTQCHVLAEYLSAYQTKFNGQVNVTFVGDLKPLATTGPEVAWDKANKTGTFTMPGGNVELEPEYFPQATMVAGAVTAVAGVKATTDDPLVTLDKSKLIGAGGMMYYVGTTDTKPAYNAEGWTSEVPTAADITMAKTVYVWYYPVGADSDNPAKTYSDGEMNINALQVAVADPPTYAVEFAEGTNNAPNKWTATPNPAKKGQQVTVTYEGPRKVMGVKAEKKAEAKTLAEATLEDIGKIAGKDGKIYATKADAEAVATGNAVAMIAYVGTASDCAHGLAIALEDVSNDQLTWNNSGSNNESKTAAEWCSAWNTSKAVTGGTWRLPSISDWQYMFIGCGASESYSDNPIQMSYSGLASKLTTAQGDALPVNDDYWSSTVASPSYPWTVLFGDSYAFFGNNTWEGHAFDLVRACLAF